MDRKEHHDYICIDLKSFYASVECAERGLDPFTANLVVADPTRSQSTICLAITPAMKKLGVRNRCRIHEIPPGIEYITAMPRMQLYIDYSARIYSIYLRYIAPEDIHVYSVDECFIDAADYMRLYDMPAKEFAQFLMDEVYRQTSITATAGIGPNLYLAKIAMDILAKHADDHIGILDEYTYRRQLWNHLPMTDFWRIGPGTVRRLASMGIFTMGDLARASLDMEDTLYKKFGTDAELLIDHAWGYESCSMSDIKNYQPKLHSLSTGQVLMRNYSYAEAQVIVREMADQLTLDMVQKKVVTDSYTLWIAYDHKTGRPASGGTADVWEPTNRSSLVGLALDRLYTIITDRDTGIRRIGICANHIVEEGYEQLNLFENPEDKEKERALQTAMIKIRARYGKNALIKCSNLLDCSTLQERNRQIGGHRA